MQDLRWSLVVRWEGRMGEKLAGSSHDQNILSGDFFYEIAKLWLPVLISSHFQKKTWFFGSENYILAVSSKQTKSAT